VPQATATGPVTAAESAGVELLDGSKLDGKVLAIVPGAYVIVERPSGKKEAVEWLRVAKIDGQPPPPLPVPGAGTLIPGGFTPDRVQKLGEAGKKFSELAPGLVAPADGQKAIGSIRGAQDVIEGLGVKRGPPNAAATIAPLFGLPFCFEMMRGTLGRVDGTGAFGIGCRYFLVPGMALSMVLAPFFSDITGEMSGPSVHHFDSSVYAIDYSKRSALTCTSISRLSTR